MGKYGGSGTQPCPYKSVVHLKLFPQLAGDPREQYFINVVPKITFEHSYSTRSSIDEQTTGNARYTDARVLITLSAKLLCFVGLSRE